MYIDEDGTPVTPLYNYLKPYPPQLLQQFYQHYGGEEAFSALTASPVLGSLNSGMQLYRLRYEKPELFERIQVALHLPQYLSYLVSGKTYSDITSIGCHTNLWNFTTQQYHDWVEKEELKPLLAPIVPYDSTFQAVFPANNYLVGPGLHDSSAALIPYLLNFHEPFALISSGTWCISLNPFNHTPLTIDELKKDCLAYLDFRGKAVKASRLFAGHMHDEQVKRIAEHFNQNPVRFRSIGFDISMIEKLRKRIRAATGEEQFSFDKTDLSSFKTDEEAYQNLMLELVVLQYFSTQLVLKGTQVKRIFVDGGFSRNLIYMNLLAAAFPQVEIYAASMAQATAMGAALAIHSAWNPKPIPNDIIELKYYAVTHGVTL